MQNAAQNDTVAPCRLSLRQVRVGFIGFGEVTYNTVRGLIRDGLEWVTIYSRSVTDPVAVIKTKKKADMIGARLSASLEELVHNCEIIISAVRGTAALETARRVSECIVPGQIYADLNNAIPAVKKQAAEYIQARGGRFVDIGLLELPIQVENKALMYASGDGAGEFYNAMTPFGMNIKILDGEVGQAAAIKAIANIFMKGLQGVCLEFAISAKKAGIRLEDLEPLLIKPVENIPREKDVALWIIRGALLAQRKKEEMREALTMLEEMDIDPVMLRSAVERLDRVSCFELEQYFDASMPYDEYEKIIDKMFEIGKQENISII
jgi:3-hydroxyisobutyrate dehydrogenase-like beta-hydroxyacid dehydrogenase